MRIAAPLVAALIVALSGCSREATQNAPQPDITQLQRSTNDALLTAAVKAKLITVDPDSTTSLGVHVSNGTATLSGRVRTAQNRAKAEAAARSVPGITTVVDQLQVDPSLPNLSAQAGDMGLTARISAAIFAQTGSTAVKVSVHQGVVTLSGTVVDPRVRDAAIATAKNTSGVKDVVDRMGPTNG